jgi:uncharacterized protein (DUF2126 family)
MKKQAAAVEQVFRRHGIVLTLGAEPTCVPLRPHGAEWNFAATGPTKLRYARRLAAAAWVLPLDRARSAWVSPAWRWERGAHLLGAEGPAGLRVPWDRARGSGTRRALTAQMVGRSLEIFLPPLGQADWTECLAAVEASVPSGLGVELCGYVPEDEAGIWRGVVLSADPGVLEINLPPSRDWDEYDRWLRALDRAQKAAGLRPWKRGRDGQPGGTGGGHHLLLGGENVDTNPFFTRPAWVAFLLRFWQQHPSLAYLFTGCYVGSSSQAPRPDESGKSIADLEMACSWLESLPPGRDHRRAITETLIHLQSDAAGNTHRSEMSFDKFWNTQFPGGTRGLIEFRALESLPRTAWASALALLWRALAAYLLDRPRRSVLIDYGPALHDRFLLPSFLWADFRSVLAELAAAGIELDEKIFRAIWDWRFPVLLENSGLTVRRALEAWPLLCETPLEGGATSRFVDTSIERLEFAADRSLARRGLLRVNGRPLPLREAPNGSFVAGLRYRSSALYPSLHPGFPVQTPLVVEIGNAAAAKSYVLTAKGPAFRPAKHPQSRLLKGEPVRAPSAESWTFDLRL